MMTTVNYKYFQLENLKAQYILPIIIIREGK